MRAAQPSAVDGDDAPAGSLLAGGAFTVATGDGALDLLTVQPAGKPAMDGAAFLRGARLEAGLVLGAPTETDA